METSPISPTAKSGHEPLTDQGQKTAFNLLDFWRWSVSDLLSNATRGRLAEFIVGTALGLSSENVRSEWDSFDLQDKDGVKIEIKSSAYLQSWHQNNFSKISFSIKPTRFWDPKTNLYSGEIKRQADLYVFCHLKHKDITSIDRLKMEQWDFYVVPTQQLDSLYPNQKSIGLGPLRKLVRPISYRELKSDFA